MKLSIHFRLRLEKENDKHPNKLITIRCHVNIDGQKEKRFSTGRCIEQARWSQDAERVNNDGSWQAQNINNQLNDIYNKLFRHFDLLQQLHSYVDSTMLIDEYELTLVPPKKTLEYYDEYLTAMNKKVGLSKQKEGISETTYEKWVNAKKHLENFFTFELKRTNLFLSHLTTAIADQFLAYMEKVCNKHGEPIQAIHAYRVFKNLSAVLDEAVKDKYIKDNPLKNSKASRPDTSDNEIFFLSEEHLLKIYDCDMLTRLERGVVDIFILLSFTGFTYMDYIEFIANPKQFIAPLNGQFFIKKRRYKDRNKQNPTVPMIPYMQIHKSILDRNNWLLPSFPVETINKQIKIIAHRLQIPNASKITSYTGRKSAATFFLNEDGIEQKTVSKILGHRDSKMLMKYYAVVQDKTVERQAGYLALKE